MSNISYISRNPSNSIVYSEKDVQSKQEVALILKKTFNKWQEWKLVSVNERVRFLECLADIMESECRIIAECITKEMGKPILQSIAEIKKCIVLCRYFTKNASDFLKDKTLKYNDRTVNIQYESLGIILGIMPWNFPFWQVFRFAIPAILSGNTVLIKHAENVPQCALLIEDLFLRSGFDKGIYNNLFIDHEQVKLIISDQRIKGVALTGSEKAGSIVSSIAGINIKPTVLELGGSDPFIVCEDADMELCIKNAVNARMQNSGQSCIAAKRFIINKSVSNEFINAFVDKVKFLRTGDPSDEKVEVGPIAREDLLDNIEKQVNDSVSLGAKILCGGKRISKAGYFYQPTVITNINKNMPLYHEEVFGPVATVFVVDNDQQAVKLANDTRYGLAASVWSANVKRALSIGRQIECGSLFINAIVKSDPAFPFGGVKYSGYGRELGEEGFKSFVNIKTYNY